MAGLPEHERRTDRLHGYPTDNRRGVTETCDHPGTTTAKSRQVVDAELAQIRVRLLEYLSGDPGRRPLGGIGIFHCRQAQALRNVPILQPVAVLVASGRKIIALGERRIEVSPGELLLLPGGSTVEIGNHPGRRGEPYLGLAMAFPQESIAQFRLSYGPTIPSDTPPLWHAPAPRDMAAAMAQWIEWCLRHPVDTTLARHRQVEILLLLARAGIAGNLLLNRAASWRERVTQLIALDPARDWSDSEVCRRLGIGESTLRRHLKAEESGFRQVLEECRMAAGLALLQETFWPVSQVAEAVGYTSHSRFSSRFKRRFGLSPTDLKRSRESKAAQKSSS